MAADGDADAGRSATQPEERKTETTLTTRIRINIPGSRPIPPVVMRTPVTDAESSDDAADAQPTSAAASPSGPVSTPQPPVPGEAAAEPAAPTRQKTSDWFAPRKSGPAKGGPGGGTGNGAKAPGGSTAGGTAAPGAPGAARPGGGSRPGGVVGAMSVSGTRPGGGTGGSGLPGATGGPVAPGHGGGTGSFDVTEVLAAGPLGSGSKPGRGGAGESRRDDLPYFRESGQDGQDGGQGGQEHGGRGLGGFDGPLGQGGQGGPGAPVGFSGPGGPAGPTSGPVTGDGPLVPPMVGGPSDRGDHGLAPGDPFGTTGPIGPIGSTGTTGPIGPDTSGTMAPGGLAGPGGPGVRPGAGIGVHRGPGGGLSDDTAILTPQKQVPEPSTPGYGVPVGTVSGHTVSSNGPIVPPGVGGPFGPGAPSDGPVPPAAPKQPEPPAQNASAARPAKKKGRSKLVLLGGAVVVLGAGVYGAGLLMNHSDVPKGTTVLGVDIGGGTRDDAAKKLDSAFGSRVDKPLKLSVDGRTVPLEPENAGLQFDYQATVAAAAHSDYNPVSVIGTLFGQQREIQPVMPIDEEKLQAALKQADGASGSVTDGTIRFESGKAVAVYGKAGKGIDEGKATQVVEQAYRTMVETGTASPVGVPTTVQQPTVSNAEVDREMKQFAEPAMSGKVTVRAGAQMIEFSPQNSLWKFLGVTAIDGKLVDKPDLAALKNLYGGTFDGVLITRGDGQKTPVTPQDVYGALRTALMSKTNRVAVIQTNPN